MFQPECTSAPYLVFKLQDNLTQTDETLWLTAILTLDGISQVPMFAWVGLPSMNVPTIKPLNDHGTHDSSTVPGVERLVMPKAYTEHQKRIEQRNDGWMEVMLCEPLHQLEDHKLLEVKLYKHRFVSLNEMIIEGIEFRPCI